ncbi:hypothetical protein [Nostoc sp. ChiSLP03a]|uniref:hypothetical protein n=1 Tax=Nostoc sp. ChiSLP03a TaxID=3075380 RepID=UPI002AD506AE|nr:hypothetical protein [Nostoc sp. ChiSLP03a]MDZ8211053.1 hypothetical protein [Nostoc sp. ChiSLP03a]
MMSTYLGFGKGAIAFYLQAETLILRKFDEPLPNPSPPRRGAEIFLVDNRKN